MPQTASKDWPNGSESRRRRRLRRDNDRNRALKRTERLLKAAHKRPDNERLKTAVESLDEVLGLFKEAV